MPNSTAERRRSAGAKRAAPRAPVAAPAGEDPAARMYRAIHEGVLAQRLPPGTRLPEAALCTLFGTRRSTVRQVLQRLAHDHVVELRPHRGAAVATPTREETRQVFEARRAVEAAVVALAAERATQADLAALRAQLQQEHSALQQADAALWVPLAGRFHLRLAELAGNPMLQRWLAETLSRCSLVVALHEAPGHAPCEHGEHAAIVERIACGDAAGAVALMEEHLRALERRLTVETAPPQRSLAQMLGLG